MQETQKKNPFESLSWRGKDDILFLPYFDEEDVTRLDLRNASSKTVAQSDGKTRSWINLPAVPVKDVKTANANCLNHLSLGAEGVLFDLSHSIDADFNQLMHAVQWPCCFVAFRANANQSLLIPLSNFMKEKFDPATVSGALFWESIPKEGKWDFYFDECSKFKCLGVALSSSSPTEEICQALLEGLKIFESLSLHHSPDAVFKSICFSLPANASFMESIAKFRALRMLWYQVAHAYGQNYYNYGDLHLHAHSYTVPDGHYAPHENMLKGTYSAMAALMGGCDSLTIDCPGGNPVIARWARNVSTILREESFFDRTTDPVAGAYALEVITHSIAEKAWKMFQLKVGDV